MAFFSIIYLLILLYLMYYVVGISLDALDWLINVIRRRQMARLMARYKKQWWGKKSGLVQTLKVETTVALDTVADKVEPKQEDRRCSTVESACKVVWTGVERRGKPKTLQPFRDYVELDEALDAVMQAELAEARYKLANSDVWHAIGQVQMRAIDHVRSLITSIPRDSSHTIWQRSLYDKLVILSNRYKQEQPVEDDLYWRIDEDQLSYYAPTVWEFVRAITKN